MNHVERQRWGNHVKYSFQTKGQDGDGKDGAPPEAASKESLKFELEDEAKKLFYDEIDAMIEADTEEFEKMMPSDGLEDEVKGQPPK